MRRWSRVNLALAIYTGALLLVLRQPAAVETAGTALTALDPTAIRHIRVERDDRLQLAFERRGNRWHMTHPGQAPAATRRVEQLLAVASAPLQQHVADADDAARYGLDPPHTVFILDDHRLAFGARDPSQRLRYVRVAERIGVVDDLYHNLLQLPATHFLDREKTP